MYSCKYFRKKRKNQFISVYLVFVILIVGGLLSSCSLLSPSTEATSPPIQQESDSQANDSQTNAIAMQATMDAMALQATMDAVNLQQTQVALQQTQTANDASVAQDEGNNSSDSETESDNTAMAAGEAAQDYETSFMDDFSNNTGRFSTTDGITIENGALYMGEFERCAEFDSDQPVGCISICETCGDRLPEYEVNLEVVYVEGITERYVGLALRFVDENGNHRIDREDYFIGWAFSLNKGTWAVWEHQVDSFTPWHLIDRGDGNMRSSPRKPNYLRVVASENGTRIDVYMNDTHVTRVVSTQPIPGESVARDMPQNGGIGLWVVERGIRVFYDNYQFTDLPSE